MAGDTIGNRSQVQSESHLIQNGTPTRMDKTAAALFRLRVVFAPSALFALFALFGFLAQTTPSLAASDGTLGITSKATTTVSIIRGETARASGLEDIILWPWFQGEPAPVGDATACIYTSTGSYQMTASSANGAGTGFRLTSGPSYLDYTVRWNDGVTGLISISHGVPVTGLLGDSTSTTCNGSNPATIQVQIFNSQMQAAPIGLYGDTLTIVITPQ